MLISLLGFSAGCGDEEEKDNVITATIDGTAQTFKGTLKAQFNSGKYFMPAGGNPVFVVIIPGSASAGSSYSTTNTDSELIYSSGADYKASNLTPNTGFNITVTQISGGRIKGSFAGKVTNTAKTTTYTITNGSWDFEL